MPIQPCLQSAVRGAGPLPFEASQRSTRSGIRTRKLFKAHDAESCSFSWFRHPGKVPLVRFELTMDLGPARVLSPAHIPFCYRGKYVLSSSSCWDTGAGQGTRAFLAHEMGRVGVAPTVFLTCLIYSQGPSLLGIPAPKKTACVEILQTDGLQPFILWDEAYLCHFFTGVFSHTKLTLLPDRRYR